MGCNDAWTESRAMSEEHTTAVIQRYLDELDADSPAEPIVRALLDRAVRRLHLLCATLLHRSYPRLTLPALNLRADELLGPPFRNGCSRRYATPAPGLCASSSRWPTSTCAGSSMTWPAA